MLGPEVSNLIRIGILHISTSQMLLNATNVLDRYSFTGRNSGNFLTKYHSLKPSVCYLINVRSYPV